jgi:Zn-dependent metalloprotease
MKTCPFCKEQVHDDAIKCRYCQSMLLPAQVSEVKQPADDRVTYILDQGLVRFGKFAAAIFALFLIAGAYLFGFKLDASVDKLQSTQTSLAAAQEKSKNIQDQMTKDQTALAVAHQKIEELGKKTEDQFSTAKTLEKQFNEALANLQNASKTVDDLSKEVERLAAKSKTSASEIEIYYERTVGSNSNSPSSAAFGQEQAGQLLEAKVLTAFRQVLTGDQYAKLEQALKAPSGLRRAIYSANNGTSLPGKLIRLEGQPATGDAAVTLVYDNIGIIHEFFRTVFGRDINSDLNGPIVATVHYNKKYNNAFWNASQIVIGDGDGEVFRSNSFASLGVLASEMGHLVVQYSAKLTYSDQNGALNTHFSDLCAVLVEQWNKKQSVDEASWLVAEGVWGPKMKGVALRSMKEPGTAYDGDSQPSHMKDLVKGTEDNGGVHINSGIPNRAFYEAARLIGGHAWEKLAKIWYQALLKSNAKTNFIEFAQRTYDVAGTLYGTGKSEQLAVKKGWQSVGIDVGGG